MTLTHTYLTIAVRMLALVLIVTAPRIVAALIRASEKATVSQMADGTVFSVTFSRPQARGRTALFGKMIKIGETWTPGAN